MRAVDTNIVVRLLARDDSKQVIAAEEFIADGAWVSHLALVETTWVLATSYRFDPAQILGAVEMLLAHKSLILQDPDVVSAALEDFRRKPKVGFADCLLLEVARKAGHLPLGTFDRDLGRLDGAEKL